MLPEKEAVFILLDVNAKDEKGAFLFVVKGWLLSVGRSSFSLIAGRIFLG